MSELESQVLGEGRFLRLVKEGRWEYVQRRNASGVVIVVARTAENEVLLIEQYRHPVGARVIEFPAGLSGDLPAARDEPMENAALRELMEETGYHAESARLVFTGPSSAGLTNEQVSFFIANDLEKRGDGGGVEHEQIDVHLVPLVEVDQWLQKKQESGCLVGARVYAGLYLLRKTL